MQLSIFFAAYVDDSVVQLGDSVVQLGDGATRRLYGATRRWGQTQNYKRLNMFRLDLCVRGKGFLNN